MVLKRASIVIHTNWGVMFDTLEIESGRLFPIFRNAPPTFIHVAQITARGPITCKDGFFKEAFRHSVSFALTQLSELAGAVIVALTYDRFRIRHSEFGQRQQDANTLVFVFGSPFAAQIGGCHKNPGVGVSGLGRPFKPFKTLRLINLLTTLARPVEPRNL